jgi:twitching motility protein PilT
MVRAMLSTGLRAVIAQTLLKRRGGGRMAAHEILIATPAVRALIKENKIAQMYSTIQTGAKDGMQTLDQNLKDLVRKGLVDVAEARAKAENKLDFAG